MKKQWIFRIENNAIGGIGIEHPCTTRNEAMSRAGQHAAMMQAWGFTVESGEVKGQHITAVMGAGHLFGRLIVYKKEELL